MIHTISSINPVCDQLHTDGHTLVLATGFFDLLHAEHIRFLNKAKELGDILIVAVESDERARAIKGEGRPIETQTVRCQHLLELTGSRDHGSTGTRKVINYIITLPDDFNHPSAFEGLISAISPHYLAVSSHTAHQDKKRLLVEKYGGQLVVVHEFNPAISTSQIIQNNKI